MLPNSPSKTTSLSQGFDSWPHPPVVEEGFTLRQELSCPQAHHCPSLLITLWWGWIQKGSWRNREVKWPAPRQTRGPWGKTKPGQWMLHWLPGLWTPDPAGSQRQEDKTKPPELTSVAVEFCFGLLPAISWLGEPMSEMLACSLCLC